MLLFGAGLHGEADIDPFPLDMVLFTKGHAPVPLQQAEGSGHLLSGEGK